jgi:hypothetical protein
MFVMDLLYCALTCLGTQSNVLCTLNSLERANRVP